MTQRADSTGDDAVDIDLSGDHGVVAVHGALDGPAGVALWGALERAVSAAVPRIEVDLHAVASFTEEGVACLARCHSMARDLADGLHYLTGPGPGREALLASYAAGATSG